MLRRLGLRAQLLLALLGAYALAASLLATAVLGVTGKGRDVERRREAHTVALALASAPSTSPEADRAVVDAVLVEGIVSRVEVVSCATCPVLDRGARTTAPADGTAVRPGGEGFVRVWLARSQGADAVAPLLVLYVAVTAAAVLALAYLALGGLIVRPVEALTRAVERLGAGAKVRVPEGGAREFSGLASAFNTMADDLARDRSALEARVAELQRTTDALRKTQDGLARSERLASVGRLAAGLAHEIGNPLAAVLGLVELLRQGGLEPGEQAELLARTHAETERIHRIVRELLDFARQEQRDAEDGDAVTPDLRDAVEDAVRLVRPQRRARGVTFELSLGDEKVAVRGAREKLSQVVVNLLLNAADAMNGEGAVRVGLGRTDSGAVQLVVHDSGPGIAPAVRGTIFEPFVTTKPAGEGTGLGLAVSHTIVTRAGGTIVAENAEAGGARFVIVLPAA